MPLKESFGNLQDRLNGGQTCIARNLIVVGEDRSDSGLTQRLDLVGFVNDTKLCLGIGSVTVKSSPSLSS